MTTNKLIFGIVGGLASGKTTLAEYLSETYNCNTYRYSTVLRDILDRVYVDQSRHNIQELSTFLRTTYGQDIIGKVIAKDVDGDANDIVVVEGIRRPTDITYLREIPGFQLIFVDANQQIRFERITARTENSDDAGKTFEQFQKDEAAEADRLISEIAKEAAYTIDNNGDIASFYKQAEAVLKQIGYAS
jgi:dephospho-CoA kinase